ncbi:hypothetical protein PN290_02400 [Romboutsia sp. 1001216sp1]|uniref:hypothetical protein n=1 Tax=unclassified Romboutsia TaxID=2626894 RepID=UPI0018AC7BBC|nr:MULTISPECIES: hypothetical protein [unclassified Romboutsia]MDB8792606.1 hypothetical protein [Romboutsia sp. 1001216sp1]MDB8796227.1 hypothetical protein [Romboutsia sp. 1001216sp1]MDB8798220.1 hypothetical protein [Romboutsia sp. 1001216sp1]
MREDLFLLDIPIFEPKYDLNKNYIYSSEEGKQNLKKVLLETSDNYCMYCYSKVLVDNKLSAHLEHSIEKKKSDKLKDCNINIAISCMKCNLSFKRVGEKKRELKDCEVKEFESNCKCESTCNIPCKAYEDIKDIYMKKEEAKIILQPFGVTNKTTNNKYKLQYNLLEQEFIVSEKYKYNDYEKDFINNHIIRFNLNDSEYRTKEVIKVCEDVNDYKRIPKKKRYNNLVADLFIDRLNSMELEKAIKMCEQITIYSLVKHTF